MDNSYGDAWTEDFKSLASCKRWLLEGEAMSIKKIVKLICRETDCIYNKKNSCTKKKVIIMAGSSCENMEMK